MEYRDNNPGAVQYGNFINYYKFNNARERVKLLPQYIWTENCNQTTQKSDCVEPYLLLDVGCNAGNLTQLLYEMLTADTFGKQRHVYILGVDIDAELVERAVTANQYKSHVSYANVNVMDSEAFSLVEEFLHKHQRHKFDAVCCFSVTMWIHLNQGDEGLEQFLHKFANLAELFVVEPQPWKCYQTAVRRMKRAGDVFPLFPKLKWRSNVEQAIQEVLETKLGRQTVYECTPTRWQRRICFYR